MQNGRTKKEKGFFFPSPFLYTERDLYPAKTHQIYVSLRSIPWIGVGVDGFDDFNDEEN